MRIIEVNVSDLRPYANNPRKNEDAVAEVAESIRLYGFRVPMLITRENEIICGHTRFEAAKRLKLEKVPCIYVDDLSEEQIRAFRLADNKVSERAQWDFDKLEYELGLLDDEFIDRLFAKAVEVEYSSTGELSFSDFDGFSYECQECGFKFNP